MVVAPPCQADGGFPYSARRLEVKAAPVPLRSLFRYPHSVGLARLAATSCGGTPVGIGRKYARRMAGIGDLIQISRRFNWGILILSNSSTKDLPELDSGPVAATPTSIVIRVRHAQDITRDEEPAAVGVVVRAGHMTQGEPDFEAGLDVTVGELTVGDAESEETIVLSSGRYMVQIQLDHPDFAQDVQIWLSPKRSQ